MPLNRFLKLLQRSVLPDKELIREWFNQLSDSDQDVAKSWMKTNQKSIGQEMTKGNFVRFKDLLIEDSVVDVISGKHHTVQIALFKGYNKSIPIWCGQRQFRIFTSGKKQALPKGLYFPAWCLPEYIKALRVLYRANKQTIDSLYKSAKKDIDF